MAAHYFTHTGGHGQLKHYPRGLHDLDLSLSNDAVIMLAMTLSDQFEGRTMAEIDGARKARCLQGMLGHPLQRHYEELVCKN